MPKYMVKFRPPAPDEKPVVLELDADNNGCCYIRANGSTIALFNPVGELVLMSGSAALNAFGFKTEFDCIKIVRT